MLKLILRMFAKRFLRFGLTLASSLAVGSVSAAAQVRPPNVPPPTSERTAGGSIRGKVVLPDGAFLTEVARITLQTMRGVEASVFTNNEGQFEFTKLRPGSYQLLVEGDRRFLSTTENVEVVRGMPSVLTIILKEKESPNRSRAKAVSTVELDVEVPAQARKEFERASKASKEGRSAQAVTHLKKAVALYPRYLLARNDLGALLLGQGKLDEAAEELRRAIELDPKAFNPHLNLGIVLGHQQKFPEAAEILKQALSLEPGSASARFYTGLALLGLNDLAGAEHELKTAHDLGGPTYAIVLFHLGQLYLNRGDREQALKMFESYLHEAPDAANVSQVRKLMTMLR